MEKYFSGLSQDKMIDFLLAELEHFGDSFWHSEEIGEKRFNYFLTWVTAVLAGLIALHTSDIASFDQAVLQSVTNVGLCGLFILGLVTFRRMLKRNSVTDEYKKVLKNIRARICDFYPELNVPQPYSPFPKGKKDSNVFSLLKGGGLAENIATIEAFLLFVLLKFNFGSFFTALGLSVLLWLILLYAAQREHS